MIKANFSGGSSDWPHLDCPKCGDSGYLHHGAINVYDPKGEDAKVGTHVYSNGSTAAINTSAPMDGCPSPRRGGLTIDLFCEICAENYRFALIQHKGKTYGGWIDAA